MVQRYCTNCGAELREDDRFCGNCGRTAHETARVSTPEADVRGCVEAIAAHVSLDPDELLELATYEAGYQARHAAHKKEEVEQEISRKVRERILPDEKTLEKITRYEAHLSRQLYHALHELENLQKHRTTGEGVPLVRMDVQGSASAES